VKDRFGGTPLADAVRHKHDAVTTFLRSQGGNLGRDMDNAAEQLCRAGATNDVAALRRLVENLVDPNMADYDRRTALHLAASNNWQGGCSEHALDHAPSPHVYMRIHPEVLI